MVSIRKFVRRIAPRWAVGPLVAIYARWNEFYVHVYDKKLFKRNRLHKLRNASGTQIESKLMFHAHSLEKGLSHLPMRSLFGERALRQLSETMFEYRRKQLPLDGAAYLNSLSVIKAYHDSHLAIGVLPTNLEQIFGTAILHEALQCQDERAGVYEITAREKINNKQKNFEELFKGRASVRNFDQSAVEPELIENAIGLATKSPSVCNRQPARVRVVADKKRIERILALQGGFNGYPPPPILLIVTSDLECFLQGTERNQVFVDGGLFSMSLLMALEYEGLAACPLNAMLTSSDEQSIRAISAIPENERIIMFIAVGNFAEAVAVPKSYRFPITKIAQI